MTTPNLYQEYIRTQLIIACIGFCIRSSSLSIPMVIQDAKEIFWIHGWEKWVVSFFSKSGHLAPCIGQDGHHYRARWPPLVQLGSIIIRVKPNTNNIGALELPGILARHLAYKYYQDISIFSLIVGPVSVYCDRVGHTSYGNTLGAVQI